MKEEVLGVETRPDSQVPFPFLQVKTEDVSASFGSYPTRDEDGRWVGFEN